MVLAESKIPLAEHDWEEKEIGGGHLELLESGFCMMSKPENVGD
jgi:hypothetical protein